jgi:hypothetical protein
VKRWAIPPETGLCGRMNPPFKIHQQEFYSGYGILYGVYFYGFLLKGDPMVYNDRVRGGGHERDSGQYS